MFVERKEYNNVITVKLVMPVGCNTNCCFCYNKDKVISYDKDEFKRNFIDSLDNIINKIGNKNPVSLDITGGEPTLDKELFTYVMDQLRKYDIQSKVCRVTLTTNGTWLYDLADSMNGVINYVNISVHDFSIIKRREIFNTDFVPFTYDYEETIQKLESIGIKVSASAVIYEPIINFNKWMSEFITWAKFCGFIALRLRCDVFWKNEDIFDMLMLRAKADDRFQVITYENTTDSHWCRLRMEDGFRVFFLHGVEDTSLKTKGIEYVIDTDGKCYCDYYRRTPIDKYEYEIGKIYDWIE